MSSVAKKVFVYGSNCQNFWQVWAVKGSSPRVVLILKDGYNLLFKIKPPLTREPLIRRQICKSPRNTYLKETLHSVLQKQAVGNVKIQSSQAFYNHICSLFSSPTKVEFWTSVLTDQDFQRGDPRICKALPSKQRVSHFATHFHFHKVSQMPLSEPNFSVLGSSFCVRTLVG